MFEAQAELLRQQAVQLRGAAAAHPTAPSSAIASTIVAASKPAKAEKEKKDPNKPKRNKNSYNIFVTEIFPDIKKEFPNSSTKEHFALIAQKWKDVPESERQRYSLNANEGKLKYQAELKDYNDNKSKGIISTAAVAAPVKSSAAKDGKAQQLPVAKIANTSAVSVSENDKKKKREEESQDIEGDDSEKKHKKHKKDKHRDH